MFDEKQPSPLDGPERLDGFSSAQRRRHETHGGSVVGGESQAAKFISYQLEGLEGFNPVGRGKVEDKSDGRRYRMLYWDVEGAESGTRYRVFQDGTYKEIQK